MPGAFGDANIAVAGAVVAFQVLLAGLGRRATAAVGVTSGAGWARALHPMVRYRALCVGATGSRRGAWVYRVKNDSVRRMMWKTSLISQKYIV